MPNIEIHGCGHDEAKKSEKKILKHCNWPDLVVTIVTDVVRDRKGKLQPFLRVYQDASNIAWPFLERLNLHLDIEVIAVHKFIPKSP